MFLKVFIFGKILIASRNEVFLRDRGYENVERVKNWEKIGLEEFGKEKFVSDLIRSASKSIILIDNYIDEPVLTLFNKRKKTVSVRIFTKVSKELLLDIEKYNSQYNPIELVEFSLSHDRFMIIDNTSVYHIGASLKDVGKKWFAFSRFDKEALEIVRRLLWVF